MENNLFDILIVGCGPAGMTAAIYAGRAEKKVAIFDKAGYGGNIARSPKVENIPGFKEISGAAFADQLFSQVATMPNINYFMSEVILVNYEHGLFKLYTDENQIFIGKTIIFATGTIHKELAVDTENVYFCSTCDGPFFKGKDVLVAGSGNTGATFALDLAQYCKTVFICDITSKMCCEPILNERIQKVPNIVWIPNASIKTVHNNKNKKLDTVYLTNNMAIKCHAIFAAVGQEPQTALAAKYVELSDSNYISAPECISTKVPGVFAAGDCRLNSVKQVTTACADGTVAALAAIKFLNK